MDLDDIKHIIDNIRNWRSLEIIRDLCIERLVNEFDVMPVYVRDVETDIIRVMDAAYNLKKLEVDDDDP